MPAVYTLDVCSSPIPLKRRSPPAAAISRLAYCNPFVPKRIECERAVLGDQFVDSDIVWKLEVEKVMEVEKTAINSFRDMTGS